MKLWTQIGLFHDVLSGRAMFFSMAAVYGFRPIVVENIFFSSPNHAIVLPSVYQSTNGSGLNPKSLEPDKLAFLSYSTEFVQKWLRENDLSVQKAMHMEKTSRKFTEYLSRE